MELTESHYRRVADCLPLPRGNVSLTRLRLRNAPLHVVERGTRAGAGVARLQKGRTLTVRIQCVALGSTVVKGIAMALKPPQ